MLLAGMAIGAGFATMGDKEAEKELEGIAKKHGLQTPKEGEAPANDPKDALKDVKDREQFFVDLMNFMEKHSKGKESPKDLATGTLKDVKINGDHASGTVTGKDGKSSQMEFVKRKDRWYFGMEK